MKKFFCKAILLIAVLAVVHVTVRVNAKNDERIVQNEEISLEEYSKSNKMQLSELKKNFPERYVEGLEEGWFYIGSSESEDNKYIYNPVKLGSGEIIYTDSNGSLRSWNIKECSEKILYKSVHKDFTEGKVLKNDLEALYLYNDKNCQVEKWVDCKVTKKWDLTKYKELTFCGVNLNLGIIFRDGTNVYALTDSGYAGLILGDDIKSVAHNVKSVLLCNYSYAEYQSNALLLQMEDGSIKVYVNDYLNTTDLDNKKYIKEISYEGGFYYPFNEM